MKKKYYWVDYLMGLVALASFVNISVMLWLFILGSVEPSRTTAAAVGFWGLMGALAAGNIGHVVPKKRP